MNHYKVVWLSCILLISSCSDDGKELTKPEPIVNVYIIDVTPQATQVSFTAWVEAERIDLNGQKGFIYKPKSPDELTVDNGEILLQPTLGSESAVFGITKELEPEMQYDLRGFIKDGTSGKIFYGDVVSFTTLISPHKFEMQAVQYSIDDYQISLNYRYDTLVYDANRRIIETHPKGKDGNSIPGMTFTYRTDQVVGENLSSGIKYTVNLIPGKDSIDYVSNDFFLQTAGYEKLAIYRGNSQTGILLIDITFIEGGIEEIDTRLEINFDPKGNISLVRNLIHIGGGSFVEDFVVKNIKYDDTHNPFKGQLRKGVFNNSIHQLIEEYSENNVTEYVWTQEGEDALHQFTYSYDSKGRIISRFFKYKELPVVEDILRIRYRE